MKDKAEYWRAYYIAHRNTMIDHAKRYSKANRARINANKRYRYRVDAEYRAHEIERSKAWQKTMRKRMDGE